MPRHSKWIAEILTPSISSSSSSVETATGVHTSSQSSIRNDNIRDIALDRKITIATEGFTTHKFCELVLKDRRRLSPRLSYKKYTIQILSELSKAVGIDLCIVSYPTGIFACI